MVLNTSENDKHKHELKLIEDKLKGSQTVKYENINYIIGSTEIEDIQKNIENTIYLE